jgi:TolB-like protein
MREFAKGIMSNVIIATATTSWHRVIACATSFGDNGFSLDR